MKLNEEEDMLQIRPFNDSQRDFDRMVQCYQIGFPGGHNRYSLKREARDFGGTIMIAEENERIIGVIIGRTLQNTAKLGALSVIPGVQSTCSLQLIQALAQQFVSLDYRNAIATTKRRSVARLAQMVSASIRFDPNHFYDNDGRHVMEMDIASFVRLQQIIAKRR